MTPEDVARQLSAEVATLLHRPPAEISPDRPLHELGLDSMSFVELMVFIERQFGVNPLEAEIGPQDIESIGRLAACVHRLQSAR